MSNETRNRKVFNYYTIGIAKRSKLMQRLQEDANNLGTQRITEVIRARLNAYYELIANIESGAFLMANETSNDKPTIESNSEDNAAKGATIWDVED